jgi:hypothetical protein
MGKINLDFEVKSDLYYLKVFDFSNWATIAKSPSIIEILRPGYTNPVIKYFDKNKVNIFNSIMLDANCINCDTDPLLVLEDGIWVFTLRGSHSPGSDRSKFSKEHKFLNTSNIQMDIDRIYIDSLSHPNRGHIIDKLTEIEFFLKAAESHLRYDMEKEAAMCFEQALKQTARLIECKTCD